MGEPLRINFAHNPTGWGKRGPIPGGMSDVHIAPVRAHLDPDLYVETDRPADGDVVNVYHTFPKVYRQPRVLGRVAVFAGHGIADKGWRNAGRVRPFAWVVTSGPAWTHRLVRSGYPRSRIIEIGYPKLDPLFAGELPDTWPERDGRVRVLWAPTHGGGGETYRFASRPPQTTGAKRTTWWARDELLALLPESEFVVREAPHPRHRPDGRSTLGEYVGADVVIADGGSTIYEAWALGLPVVFPSWLTAKANIAKAARTPTFEGDIYRLGVGRHASRPEEFADLVEAAAAEGISDTEVRFIEPILPAALRGGAGARFAGHLARIASMAPLGNPGQRVTFERHGKRVTMPADSERAARYARSDRWKLVGTR